MNIFISLTTREPHFDRRTYCEKIGREAWGYVEYEEPINPARTYEYELTPPTVKVKTVKPLDRDSWRRKFFEDEGSKVWKYTELENVFRKRHDHLFRFTNNSYDGEPCWPTKAEIDNRIKEEINHE